MNGPPSFVSATSGFAPISDRFLLKSDHIWVLDGSLKNGPQFLFGKSLDFGSGPAQKFNNLIALRSRLMHYRPENQDFEYENVVICGTIDIGDYNSLTGNAARDAIASAEQFATHLFEHQKISPEQCRSALHH